MLVWRTPMNRLDESKKARRREHNRKKMLAFFSAKDRHGRPRDGLLQELGAAELLRLLKWFQSETASMEAIQKYAISHRRAVRELDEEDVKAVQDLFLTRSVLES